MSRVGFGRISVTKIENGLDAYSAFLSGYSFSVPTDSSLVVSELTSQTVQVYACKGETQISDFTIGNIVSPPELSVSVNNANKTVTLTANKGIVMSSSRDEIRVPIEITDVGSVTQVISFSCTIRGDDGDEGIGYSVILENESHLFEGDISNALEGSIDTKVIAYKNNEQTISTIKSIDGKTVSGNVSVATTIAGLTAVVSNNGTANSTITFKSTSDLTTKSKAIPVVIEVDGKTFTKYFSYSISLKGEKGDDGIPASYVTTVASSQIFKAESDSDVYTPDESIITPTLNNCTFVSWEYSLDGGTSWTSVVTGTSGITLSTVKGNPNCLTVSSDSELFNSNNVIPFRINCSNNASDVITIARLRDGNTGDPGVSPGLVTITAKGGQAFVEKKNGKSYNPSTISLTPKFQNCEFSKWQYSLDPEDDSSWVDAVSGTHSIAIGTSTKVLTIGSSSDLFSDDVNAITFRVLSNEDDLMDTMSIARVKRGVGYTILLSNESYTFSGTTTHANAESIPVEFTGYWNSEVLPVTITSIGGTAVSEDMNDVSTGITGLTADVSNNNTTNCVITFKATTSLTQKNGVVEIGILFDSENIVKKFSYSISMKGEPGKDGISFQDITEYYLISDKSTGITVNTTGWNTTIPSMTNTERYLWNYEKITCSDGTTTSYIQTDPKVIGVFGDTGDDGISISSVSNKYLVSPDNTGITTSTSGWKDTPQIMTATNKYLWTYEIITYSDNSITNTTPIVIGAYGDQGEQGEEGVGYTILLSNESHQFEGSETAAKAGSTSTTIVAYKNTTKSAVTITSIDGKAVSGNATVSTTVTGLSAAVTNNGSTSADTTVTFTATTSLTTASKAIPIVMTIDGKTFTKYFSYSIAFKGVDGTSVTVSSTSVTYQVSSSGTTTPTTWVNNIPTVSAGQYLWTKTVVTYSDGKSTTTYTVSRSGTNGVNGDDGKGISSIVNYYLASASATGITTSTSGWKTTIQTMTSTNKYLWNYEVITYTDESTTTTTPCIIGVYGDKGNTGATGNGIKSITEHYLVSTSNTGITTSTSGWVDSTAPALTSTSRYLWNYETILYTDNRSVDTTPKVIGVYGDKGDTGATGATGNGIKSITEHYAVSSSNSTAPTSWYETIQTMTSTNKYLWNYETILYTDNTSVDTIKRVIGVYGDKGNTGATGAAGNGIKSVTNYYLASASATGITTSTSGWTTSVQSVTSTNKYLWNYEVITYTNGSNTTTTPCIIGAYGDKGDTGATGATGNGIKSVTNYYLATVSSSGVTTSTSGWTTTVQSVTSTNKYLWNYEVIAYTNGTNTTTTPCIIGAYGNTGATGANGVSVTAVDVYYYLSSSSTALSGGSWSTTAPTWANGKYMWSKTIITYSDTSTSESNPVCITGAKGSTGNTGASGSNGKGVTSIVEEYYQSTSATSLSGGSWSTTYPGWTDGKYVWTRSIITYTDNTTTTTSAVCVTGSKGNTGATGNGISGIVEHYAVSSSNSTAPTSWFETVQTMTSTNKYLWNYETITYTDNSVYNTAKRVIGVYGDKGNTGATGATGKGIKSIANYYLASTSSSGVTTSTSGWTNTIQTITSSKRYLWNYEVITYTDESTTPTAPCIIGVYGATGATGSAGKGISSITEYYKATNSSTTEPTSWETTVPTMTTTNKYLWNYEVITYTDNSTSESAKRVIGVYGNTGATGTAGINTATVFLYQRETSPPAVPSSALTYTFSTRALSGKLGSWTTSIPSGTKPIYITSASVSAKTATASIATTAWSTPVVLAKNGATGATGTSVNSIVTLYYASTDNTTPTPTPTAPSVSSNTISYGSWTDDPTAVDWSGDKSVFTMTLVSYKNASGTITIECSDASYDKTWETIKETNTGMLQNSEMIGLIATKGSTGSSITLTNIMIAAMTSQFTIKAPNGTTTIIEGGKINTNAIAGTNGSINLSAGTFSYGNTTNGMSWDGISLKIYGSGTFTGSVTATSGSFTGEVTATSGSFNGSITATSLKVTKTIQMYNATRNATLPVIQFGDNGSLYIGGTQDQQTFTDIGVWGNITVSGQVGANYLYGDSGISTNGTVSGSSFIASGGTFKGVKTAAAVTTLGFGTNNDYCATISLLAHWNGAYTGTSSNLAYCNRGAFGTIVTKSTSDYAAASHTHTSLANALQLRAPDDTGTARYAICTHNSNPVTRIWMSAASTLGIYGKKGGTATGNKTTFTVAVSSSDIRLKDNIKDSNLEVLPIIDIIKTRQFDWNDGRENPHREIGIVADEIQKLDKAFVTGGGVDENGDMIIKSIDTLHLSSYLIKGEQELHAKIKDLKKQNEEKDKKIESLESAIQDLIDRVTRLE